MTNVDGNVYLLAEGRYNEHYVLPKDDGTGNLALSGTPLSDLAPPTAQPLVSPRNETLSLNHDLTVTETPEQA